MQWLQTILENSQYAALTAFILGLMTAISPCPLATNISAIGFISRDIENRRRVFLKGLVYTLGRAITYTGLGIILYFGASKMHVSMLFQGWGEKILGPLLIIIGILMLDFIKIQLPGFTGLTEKNGRTQQAKLLGNLTPWNGLRDGLLPLQRCTLFRHADPNYHCQCQRIVLAGRFRHCYRTPGNHLRLAACICRRKCRETL